MLREQPNGLLVVTDQATFSERTRIIDFAREHTIVAAYEFTEFEFKEFAFLGRLVSHGPSLDDIWRRAVHHIDKIFKGAKPADLPVEQPTKFELFLNLKTVKTLGLTVPPAARANRRGDRVGALLLRCMSPEV